jgi:peptidoglycan/LPS O-acetylase OafA/YrhL
MSTEPARKLNALTSLRFFAAGLIVYLHVGFADVFGLPSTRAHTFPFQNGVAFFFVLSGFILAYVYSSRPRLERRRFLLARVARIWPAHVTALILGFVLVPGAFMPVLEGPTLLANVTMVQSWIPWVSYYQSYVAQSWSISAEFAFYLCFVLLAPNWQRTWIPKLLGSLAFLIGVLTFINLMQTHHPRWGGIEWLDLVYFHPLPRVFEFTVGMAAAALWRRFSPVIRQRTAVATLLECGAIALAFFVMQHASAWMQPLKESPWIGLAGGVWLFNSGFCCLPFAALIFVMALGQGWVSRILSGSFFVLLGEISYSIYLIHSVLLTVFMVKAKSFAGLPGWLLLGLFLGIVLFASYLVWALVERPCRGLLIGLWPKLSNVTAVALPASMITAEGAPIKPAHPEIVLPSRQGILVAGLSLAVLTAIVAGRVMLVPNVEIITPERAGEIAAAAGPEVRDVRFGDRFLLRGAVVKRLEHNTIVETAWESLADQPLDYHLKVFLFDSEGRTTGDLSFRQDESAGLIRTGALWRQAITVPAAQAGAVATVGLSLLRGHKSYVWLPIDRGPRDLNDTRLLVPVPAATKAAAAALQTDGVITANPNPVKITEAAGLGVTTLSWSSSKEVEVHVNSPSGALFTRRGPGSYSRPTGPWVTDGMVFYLQNVSDGLPLTPENTLGTVTVSVSRHPGAAH